MELHHGQTIERIIRRNGYSITELARLTKVNRRSVYNWFNQRHLKPEIIYRIGSVINYDFSSEFPSLFSGEEFTKPSTALFTESLIMREHSDESCIWKNKYIELLEQYNQLLLICIERKTNLERDL